MGISRWGLSLMCVCVLAACSARDATPTRPILPTTQPATIPSTTPAVTPSYTPQRVNFAVGATSINLTAQPSRDTAAAYVLRILAGQTMTVRVSPVANIIILDAAGNTLTSASGAVRVKVPQAADYVVVISGEGQIAVTISIPPAAS